MITVAIVYWIFVSATIAFFAYWIVKGFQKDESPAMPRKSIKIPNRQFLTTDRIVLIQKAYHGNLTPQEEALIKNAVREWDLLQDAYDEANRLIKDTEKGL